MSDLSPETLALLDRARDGEAMPAAHRSAMRRRLALAVGVAAPLAMGSTAAASVSAAAWVARGLAILGTVGAVSAAVVVPSLRTPNPPPAAVAAPPARAATMPPVVRRSTETVVPPVSPAPPVAESPALPEAGTAPPVAPAPLARRVFHAAPALPVAAPPVVPVDHAERLEDTLAAEVRLVNGARAAIDAGDPSLALGLLADHQRRFASGALEPEASALRVDALCAAGRTPEAEAEALRFRTRHPGSPLERRLAATCARGAPR